MQRCIELAARGIGNVAPNPMVGAVLVNKGRIIGEGYHESYGHAHAEVNCINNVSAENIALIRESTLFVSLEPCNHFGKTPPCTDLIIKHNIPNVVIGCRDSFGEVNEEAINKLRAAGIAVEVNMLQHQCRQLNRSFFTFQEKKRPYIILKWAQSADGKIAGENGRPIKISNDFANTLVHRWRTEEAAILAGTNTILNDDPSLTARHWPGRNPVRIVLDMGLKVSPDARVFDDAAPTIIINRKLNKKKGSKIYLKIDEKKDTVEEIINCLYGLKLNAVIIEGGAATLLRFIDKGLWDEARVITNQHLFIKQGISSPLLKNEIIVAKKQICTDIIMFYKHKENEFL